MLSRRMLLASNRVAPELDWEPAERPTTRIGVPGQATDGRGGRWPLLEIPARISIATRPLGRTRKPGKRGETRGLEL